MRKLVLILSALPSTAFAQAQAGWGNVGQHEEKGFSWTDPLWPDFWMAWTPATLAVFVGIFSAIALIGILEVTKFRDGIERCGVLLHLIDGTQEDLVGAYQTVRAELEASYEQHQDQQA